jgi:hypothetical protein
MWCVSGIFRVLAGTPPVPPTVRARGFSYAAADRFRLLFARIDRTTKRDDIVANKIARPLPFLAGHLLPELKE